jgi:hypothetical protein
MTTTDRGTSISAGAAHRHQLKASYQPNMIKAWAVLLLMFGITVAVYYCIVNAKATKYLDWCGLGQVVTDWHTRVGASTPGDQSPGTTSGGSLSGLGKVIKSSSGRPISDYEGCAGLNGYKIIKNTGLPAISSPTFTYGSTPFPIVSEFVPRSGDGAIHLVGSPYGDNDFGLPKSDRKTFEPRFAMPDGIGEQQITRYEPPYVKMAELRLSLAARKTENWKVEALIFFGARDGIDSILVIVEQPDTLGLGKAVKKSLENGFCWSGRLCSANDNCTKVAAVVHFIFEYREGSLTYTFGEENLTLRLPAEYRR